MGYLAQMGSSMAPQAGAQGVRQQETTAGSGGLQLCWVTRRNISQPQAGNEGSHVQHPLAGAPSTPPGHGVLLQWDWRRTVTWALAEACGQGVQLQPLLSPADA